MLSLEEIAKELVTKIHEGLEKCNGQGIQGLEGLLRQNQDFRQQFIAQKGDRVLMEHHREHMFNQVMERVEGLRSKDPKKHSAALSVFNEFKKSINEAVEVAKRKVQQLKTSAEQKDANDLKALQLDQQLKETLLKMQNLAFRNANGELIYYLDRLQVDPTAIGLGVDEPAQWLKLESSTVYWTRMDGSIGSMTINNGTPTFHYKTIGATPTILGETFRHEDVRTYLIAVILYDHYFAKPKLLEDYAVFLTILKAQLAAEGKDPSSTQLSLGSLSGDDRLRYAKLMVAFGFQVTERAEFARRDDKALNEIVERRSSEVSVLKKMQKLDSNSSDFSSEFKKLSAEAWLLAQDNLTSNPRQNDIVGQLSRFQKMLAMLGSLSDQHPELKRDQSYVNLTKKIPEFEKEINRKINNSLQQTREAFKKREAARQEKQAIEKVAASPPAPSRVLKAGGP